MFSKFQGSGVYHDKLYDEVEAQTWECHIVIPFEINHSETDLDEMEVHGKTFTLKTSLADYHLEFEVSAWTEEQAKDMAWNLGRKLRQSTVRQTGPGIRSTYSDYEDMEVWVTVNKDEA